MLSAMLVLLWCYYFLESSAIWESCRGVLLPQCRQACPAVQRKKTKPSCMSTHESSKVARSQQANTTNIKHHNPLRRRHMAASARMNL